MSALRARTPARSDLAASRARGAALEAKLYESHYLTAVAPEGGRAVWIRYTTDKPAGEPPRGRLWCTVFDRASQAPLARRTAGEGEVEYEHASGWIQIGDSEIGPDGAEGKLEELAWELQWCEGSPQLGYLPKSWLYDKRLPRSNGVALVPDTTFTGHLKIGDQHLGLDGWRGMVGHNWGSDHAERWIWAHVTGLGERDGEGWLDMVLARTRVGRWLTPWLPAGAIQVDGARKRIGLGAGTRGLRVFTERERARIELPNLAGGGLRLEARMPAQSTVLWDYVTPAGGSRDARNCSIGSGTIELGDGPAIEIDGRLVVEVGV